MVGDTPDPGRYFLDPGLCSSLRSAVRRGRGSRDRAGKHPERLSFLYYYAARSVLRGRQHHFPGRPGRFAPGQSPVHRCRNTPFQHHRDHRFLHADGASADQDELLEKKEETHHDLLHLPCLQHGRVPDTSGRSAPADGLHARRPVSLEPAPLPHSGIQHGADADIVLADRQSPVQKGHGRGTPAEDHPPLDGA